MDDCKLGGVEATCCVCDNYQQAINTRAAPRFLRARYWIGPIYFSLDRSNTTLGGPCWNIAIRFDMETRMVWLPDGEEDVIICLAVLT